MSGPVGAVCATVHCRDSSCAIHRGASTAPSLERLMHSSWLTSFLKIPYLWMINPDFSASNARRRHRPACRLERETGHVTSEVAATRWMGGEVVKDVGETQTSRLYNKKTLTCSHVVADGNNRHDSSGARC